MKHNFSFLRQSQPKQYIYSVLAVILVSVICFLTAQTIGYRSVALILLATISVLSVFFTLYPVLISAALSALIWDFFFIPPHFTLHIGNSEDMLMLLMYFIVALTSGFLASKVRLLEKIELQKEERQNTIKLYKTLFDSISHELRTPIATIVGASDNLLQKDSPLSVEDKSGLTLVISDAAFRLNRLVDNLLNMQRLESGMLQIKPDWCDINELINSAVKRLENELSTHTLKISVQDYFPIVQIDYGLIEQSLFNILHNETLYTPADSEIEIKAVYENELLTLIVSDNGQGFSSDELERLFSKFYRGHSGKTGGTGLGLSIVKGFVEAHGGKVSVANNPDHGAVFKMYIPAKQLELNDYSDFTDMTIREHPNHQTVYGEYIRNNPDVKFFDNNTENNG